ncbi:ABC transporter substrate-binding protein [Robbsia sp. KACC 23696]|uniref:ABC transporter substrate-binding protein n=1 Tax=Robbsia sp. KACC 23696 TaxID=3149231 RepID=UPI00325C008B
MSFFYCLKRTPNAWRGVVAALGLLAMCVGQPSQAATVSETPAGAVAVPALPPVPERYRRAGTLTVAVNPEIAPIKFVDDDGNIAGFTPDLLTAAAKLLGLKLQFVQTSFDSLVPGLSAKRFDVLLSLGDFPSRHGQVTFIDYLKVGQTIVTVPGNRLVVHALSELCGVSAGLPRGTAQLEQAYEISKACVAAGKQPMTIATYPDTNMTLLALTTGANQIAWIDSPAANYNLSRFPDKYRQAFFYYNSAYGIGFGTDDEGRQLADAFRQALLRVEAAGGYAALMQKWDVPPADGFSRFPINDPSY